MPWTETTPDEKHLKTSGLMGKHLGMTCVILYLFNWRGLPFVSVLLQFDLLSFFRGHVHKTTERRREKKHTQQKFNGYLALNCF